MPDYPSPRMTLCLAIDLKKSTATGMELPTKQLDRFNLALVRQVTPHLTAVGLQDAVIKFTGDGWLIITDNTDEALPYLHRAYELASPGPRREELSRFLTQAAANRLSPVQEKAL